MNYLAIQYRVLFHDTMAYGTHHFLTNFHFQCHARERLFFRDIVGGSDAGRQMSDDHVFLTNDAYARNLSAVGVGERVVVLMSAEQITAVSVRFCFRVVRQDGVPVSAGFQTVVALSKATGQPAAPPEWVRAYGTHIQEPLSESTFADRVLAGRTRELFDPRTIALARRIAVDRAFPADGDFVTHSAPLPRLDAGPVFLFPGQGSHDPQALRALLAGGGLAAEWIARADAIGRDLLGASLIALLQTGSEAEYARQVAACPDLLQLAITALGLGTAQVLIERGLQPALLVGHSVGEIAALGIGGAYGIDECLTIACLRARSLRTAGCRGGMLALSCPPDQRAQLCQGVDNAWPAVINHDQQGVISGDFVALETVEARARAVDVRTRRVRSPYPFHCPLLRPAVPIFADALRPFAAAVPRIPVYSPIDAQLFDDADAIAPRLAEHFVRPLDFAAALRTLRESGATTFAECGGKALGGFLKHVLGDGVRMLSPLPAAKPGKPDSLAAPALAPEPVPRDASANRSSPNPDDELIAIVATGCVLPGAADPADLWRALLEGRNGLWDLADRHPDVAADFLQVGASAPTPDKTYTLLGGFIRDLPAVPDVFPPEEAAGLTSAQRFLAAALDQCVGSLDGLPPAERIALFLGATADGIREYDEALLAVGMLDRLAASGASEADREPLAARIRAAFWPSGRPAADLAPVPSATQVGERILGGPLRVVAVDAACASSLHAVDLGVRALLDGSCDLAVCGGFFAPGPANSCLFSQFRGLSATASRPFDREADGVVFGEGAALLALCRLSDAVAAGQNVLAVIRGLGTSSDGRSPSVAVPTTDGQVLAMRRAWERAGLDPATAQFVEAHATSTPVGDATEFRALQKVFGDTRSERPIGIGSLKAMTGHTGWTAGSASIIKICEAFAHETVPGQPAFETPQPGVFLGERFTIDTTPRAWVERPRRAAVNGFGFGGSNVHVVLESIEPDGMALQPRRPPARRVPLVVVGIGAQLPPAGARCGFAFAEGDLTLPPGPSVLPDVLDDVDRSQLLALRVAHDALGTVPWQERRQRVGVVLAIEGKTERSLRINERIYADRVHRLLGGDPLVETALPLTARPSGPYTLPGLMPNVAAGRIANFFDLQGPNVLLDAGAGRSLWEVLSLAEQELRDDTCELVLAGALNATTGPEVASPDGRPVAEGALMLAVTTSEHAAAWGVPVLGVLRLADDTVDRASDLRPGSDVCLRGAEGVIELAAALDRARTHHLSARLRLPAGSIDVAGTTDPPIRIATPRVWPAPLPPGHTPRGYAGRRVLVLADAPLKDLDALRSGPLASADLIVLCPVGADVPGAIAIDLSSDAAARAALDRVDLDRVDTVVAVKRLGDEDALSTLTAGGRLLLDLLFVMARALAVDVRDGRVAIGCACLNALRGEHLPHPWTGLAAGLLKAISRELPGALCKAVVMADDDSTRAFESLSIEWGLGARDGEVETLWGRGRSALRLEEIDQLAVPDRSLDASSVVVATGGARGVTAVLMEALLREIGCTVVLVGRSAIEDLPSDLGAMDDAAFEQFEKSFYADQRARDPDVRLAQLKPRLEKLRGAREAALSLDRMRRLPGRVLYRQVDLTDAAAVRALVAQVFAELGRLDLIVHGAGVQVSGSLGQRTLEQFRQVIDTKVGGLMALVAACAEVDPKVRVHLLSSTFSVLGNDGQPDYGAANEAMGRLADLRRAQGEDWTSFGWLGWAAIGMTKGSEYAALSKARGLRPILPFEGAALFTEMLRGKTEAASLLAISDGELSWYREPLLRRGSVFAGPSWPLNAGVFPLATRHCVDGKPTLPGTFEVDLAMQAAHPLRPDWVVGGTEALRWLRFARVREGATGVLRSELSIEEVTPTTCVVFVRLVADVVDRSGRTLAQSVPHFEARVRLRSCGESLGVSETAACGGSRNGFADPYHLPGSPVTLSSPFAPLTRIELAESGRLACFDYDPDAPAASLADFLSPAVLMDAACRFAMIHRDDAGAWPVYVPISCRALQTLPGTNDCRLMEAASTITLVASVPEVKGPYIYNHWAEGRAQDGRVLLRAHDLVARRVGATHMPATDLGDAP